MTEKLTRRQLMRRGLWLTVGAAFVPAWARRLSEDVGKIAPKPRVFIEADYTALELHTFAAVAMDVETNLSWPETTVRYAKNDAIMTQSLGRTYRDGMPPQYDSGVRYRVMHHVHDEVILEEDPSGKTLREIFGQQQHEMLREFYAEAAMRGVTFDQSYVNKLRKRYG